jgi:hypothetical protein
VTDEDDAQGRVGARASGGLIGLGSAGGGLTVGPETLLGKILILASPITSVLIDYAVIQGRASMRQWEQQRPIRQARKTLKRAIEDPHTPEERKAIYRQQLADLHDVAIAQQLARLATASAGGARDANSSGS